MKKLIILLLVTFPGVTFASWYSDGVTCNVDGVVCPMSECTFAPVQMNTYTPAVTTWNSTYQGKGVPVTPDPAKEAQEKKIAELIAQNERLLQLFGSGTSTGTLTTTETGALSQEARMANLRARFYQNQSARIEAHRQKMQNIRQRFLEIQKSELPACQSIPATCDGVKTPEEAQFYLRSCGATKFDRDSDGIACERD